MSDSSHSASCSGADASPVGSRRLAVVTGLSGAGRSSVLRVLEDLGYETVDNLPVSLLNRLLAGGDGAPLAVGIDARTRHLDVPALGIALEELRGRADLDLRVVFVTADPDVLLRRFSETRRRHPLAPGAGRDGVPRGGVAEGIAREEEMVGPLRASADWLLDTSDLPLPELRRQVEGRLQPGPDEGGGPMLALSVRSFAFPTGLPRDADLVFDLRFLRNPHYDPILRPMTGQDVPVAAYIETDPAFAAFWDRMTALLDLLLPRYAAEGKKYLTIALGCTGGRHRSVFVAERLAIHLTRLGWPVDLSHRELHLAPGTVAPPRTQQSKDRAFPS